MSTFDSTASTAAIDNFLSGESNHLSSDVRFISRYRSAWNEVIPKTKWLDQDGARKNRLIYKATLPKYEGTAGSGAFNTIGAKFSTAAASVNSTDRAAGTIVDSTATGRGALYNHSRADFAKVLRVYELEFSSVVSPFIDLEAIRSTTQLKEQLSAIKENLADITTWIWEDRYRGVYGTISDNVVVCRTSSSPIVTGQSGTAITAFDVDPSNDDSLTYLPTANISEAILDRITTRLAIQGGAKGAYGMADGQPVHLLVCSPEAKNRLLRESGTRDDIRESAMVDELLKPLGANCQLRGWSIITDFKAPRANYGGSGDVLTAVPAETTDSDGISLIPNTSYDSASFEFAFVVNKEVCESEVPGPTIGSSDVTFDPQNYSGQYSWSNNKDDLYNPFGTRGRYLGRLAHAMAPIRPELGYVILFKRDSAVSAE